MLAWLTLRARSLWPAVILHFGTDLLILPQKLGTPRHGWLLLGTAGSFALVAALLYALPRRHARDPHLAEFRRVHGLSCEDWTG